VARSRDAITGAFGYTGRVIAEQLLDAGREVVTLSRRSGDRDPLASRITVHPFNAERPALVASLADVDTLYNTYWLRFPRGRATYDSAVARSATLVAAAREAGVRRIVHVSVVGAAADAPTPYVRAKAAVEAIVRGSGLEWSIVRPTLTFGRDDILFNNLAWALRRLPVYGIPGRGRYRVQPVHVEDVARICLEVGAAGSGRTVDAAGPETLEYRELVAQIRRAVGSRSLVVPMPAPAVLLAARLLGVLVRDVVLTPDEVRELTSSWLTSDAPPLGRIGPTAWIAAHGDELGRQWASELARNYRPAAPPADRAPRADS
jgi:uncharacterized protein YbjT (DUF2867 family)